MIRLERVTLPEGLRALLHRDQDGDVVIYISDALDAKRQRVAVVEAIRASRRAGWRAGLAPVGVALLVALRAWLGRSIQMLSARPTAWVPAATALAVGASAAGIFFAAAPHRHSASAPAVPPAISTVMPHQPGSQQRAHAGHRGQAQPVAAVPSASLGPPAGPPSGPPAGPPQPAPTSPGPSPAPTPPVPITAPPPSSPPSPPPSPVPSPSQPPPPSGGRTGVCVIVLGIRVCVPALSLAG